MNLADGKNRAKVMFFREVRKIYAKKSVVLGRGNECQWIVESEKHERNVML